MSWPWRALAGPSLWAVAFSMIYAVHGLGCAWGWPGRAAPIGDLHNFVLIMLWLVALAAASAILWHAPRGNRTSDRLIYAGSCIGLIATILTLFPVLGLTTCGAGA